MMTHQDPGIRSKSNSKVSFAGIVRVRKCLSIYEYTKEEIKACWYDAAESKVILQDSHDIACLMDTTNLSRCVEGRRIWARGLETLIGYKARLRRRNRRASKSAVFQEQARQTQEKKTNADRIAKVYSQYTTIPRATAHRMGLADQLAKSAPIYGVKNCRHRPLPLSFHPEKTNLRLPSSTTV